VLEASSGYSAMAIADGYPNEIDILLTDVMMPGIPGPQLALRSSRPNLKIVLMSGTPNMG
jgi:two-component system cell cycle sensor histidine kinase/response regulator CckA